MRTMVGFWTARFVKVESDDNILRRVFFSSELRVGGCTDDVESTRSGLVWSGLVRSGP